MAEENAILIDSVPGADEPFEKVGSSEAVLHLEED
jgi:hypothetical protein